MTTATANPNHVNKSSSDARSAVSSCPLELKNIQLIPLRYGLVERHVYAEVPPRVEYSLTESGRTLEPVLVALSRWGRAHT